MSDHPPMRLRLDDGSQYRVRLYAEAEITQANGGVEGRLEWAGLSAIAGSREAVFAEFSTEINRRCNDPSDGSFKAVLQSYIRAHGTRIPDDEIVAERAALEAEWKAVPSITSADLDGLIASGGPVVVDFWAEWCRPCLALAPVLCVLAEEWGERIAVRKVNIEQEPGLVRRCAVQGVPTLVVFADGVEVRRIVGFHDAGALRRELEPLLG